MYKEAYKSTIARAKKLQAQEGSKTTSSGLMSKPRAKKTGKSGEAKAERWDDVMAQYVLMFHNNANEVIKQIHSASKKNKKGQK